MTGDTESVVQNLAWLSNFPKIAPFRICPKLNRKEGSEFETTLGQGIPPFQKITVDYNIEKLECLNMDQDEKPGNTYSRFPG